MPIAATLPLLQTQLANVMRLKQAGTADSAAAIMSSALAQSVSTGLLPGVPPIPTLPTGLPLAYNSLREAFSLGKAAQSNLVAQKVADAVKLISPIVPPTGYVLLLTQLQQAFNLQIAGTPESFATIAAAAIITYFSTGTVF